MSDDQYIALLQALRVWFGTAFIVAAAVFGASLAWDLQKAVRKRRWWRRLAGVESRNER